MCVRYEGVCVHIDVCICDIIHKRNTRRNT